MSINIWIFQRFYVKIKSVMIMKLKGCGALTDWFRKELAGNLEHTLLESKVTPDEPGEIMVLPHFAGAATPYWEYASLTQSAELWLWRRKNQACRFAFILTTERILHI